MGARKVNIGMNNIKSEFPVFQKNPELVYLDSGASALTPKEVIKSINWYYSECSVNVHRGLYEMSECVTEACEKSRELVAKFINADRKEEIIFTNGTTHGLNLLAYQLAGGLSAEDNIVITRLEHHANLVPWQEAVKRTGCELRFIELNDDYQINLNSARELIDKNTKIVSFATMSNVLGTYLPSKELISIAKEVDATTILDAAQGIVHQSTDVQELDCDFLVFGGHKIYGPTGVGVIYGKYHLLEAMQPLFFGGDMISEVRFDEATWAEVPYKFEAGTPHISGIIGLGAAIKFVKKIGWDSIEKHEKELTDYAMRELEKVPLLNIIGPKDITQRGGVFSFTIDGIHPPDISDILGKQGIATRAGSHCAMPLMQYLGIYGTSRASFGIYNDKNDIDSLMSGISRVKEIFSK